MFNFDDLIGKYVIIRSYNDGVNAGKVLAADKEVIHLQDARRLYYHAPKDTNMSWYEGVALSGLNESSRVSPAVDKVIQENYSVTFCTPEAERSIREFPSNKQS